MRFGADLNAYTSFDETVYELTVPTDSAKLFDKGFEILADWSRGLTFDSTELARERGVVIEEWRLGRGAAARMRDKQFPVIFSGSRYAERIPIGDKHTLETAPALRRSSASTTTGIAPTSWPWSPSVTSTSARSSG